MHVGSINDCLSQFLHVPGGNWLRVGQFCGKYLETGLHVKIQDGQTKVPGIQKLTK